ncbi:Uncharacterised protein [Mycobacteroides abscessus subsp. abscessus]|nr:Uncharacterised protein [Mycobacteroides abscessus subsp. abscessus]
MSSWVSSLARMSCLIWISPTLPLSPRTFGAMAGLALAAVTGLTTVCGSMTLGSVRALATSASIWPMWFSRPSSASTRMLVDEFNC